MNSIFSKLCFATIAGIFLFSSCKKTSDTTTNGTEEYSPATTGSSWTYLNTPGSVSVLTVTARDTVALGRTYKVLSNSNGPNNYRAKVGGDYYRLGTVPAIGASVEELYLKDGQNVNAAWNSTQSFTVPGISGTLTATFNYTLKEKGITRVAGAQTFSNVVHVRLDISIPLLGNIGGGDFYYAQGIGLIEGTVAVTVPGQPAVNQMQVLTAFDVK